MAYGCYLSQWDRDYQRMDCRYRRWIGWGIGSFQHYKVGKIGRISKDPEKNNQTVKRNPRNMWCTRSQAKKVYQEKGSYRLCQMMLWLIAQ